MRTVGKITALPRKLGLESRFCHLFFPLAPFPQDAIFLLRYVATWIFSSRKTHDSTRYSKATRTPICDLKHSWREPWVVYLCEAPKCAMPFMKGLPLKRMCGVCDCVQIRPVCLLAYVERLLWTCHFPQDRATSQHRENIILFLLITSLRHRTFPLNLLKVKSVSEMSKY